MHLIAELFIGIVGSLFGTLIGLRLQRRRAEKSRANGRLRCAVRLPAATKKGDRKWRRGEAELGGRRLKVAGLDLEVLAAELPGVSFPEFKQPDGPWALWFDPAIRVVRLQTSSGAADWAVHEGQADWAVEELGFGVTTAAG